MTNPITGPIVITSPFGPRKAPAPGASTQHKGLDLRAPLGTAVLAPITGVLSEQDGGAGGLTAVITREVPEGRVRCLLMHLDSLERDLLGRQVDQGCLIARSGQSGVATGPHLHIQIELTPIGEAPKWVDPALFLNEV